MITAFADPFDALLNLQRALDASFASDWLQDLTTSRGPFPPINVFQRGDDILAISANWDSGRSISPRPFGPSFQRNGTATLI
jgi:hypothetical protein